MPTEQGDYIGFTNEGDVGAISFSYKAERRTLFIGQHADAMVRVGDEYVFNNHLRVEFAIAVQLSTGQFDDVLYSEIRAFLSRRFRI